MPRCAASHGVDLALKVLVLHVARALEIQILVERVAVKVRGRAHPPTLARTSRAAESPPAKLAYCCLSTTARDRWTTPDFASSRKALGASVLTRPATETC